MSKSIVTELTSSLAHELFSYDADTGIIIWLVTRGSAVVGNEAGNLDSGGHRQIFTHGRRWMAHRIAWLLHYGEFPVNEIDHINGIREDNRISNLRDVIQRENQKNKRLPNNSSTGVIGVCWHKAGSKWAAQIMVDRKNKHLGIYGSLLDAVCARKSAEIKYGFHENHGRTLDTSRQESCMGQATSP